MFKGHFQASLFYKISAPVAIVSLIVIYYQSQYYHHQPPFPHQFISIVAQHYPEFVVFRLGTISTAVLILLGWLTNHFFLQTVAVESGINIKKYHTEVPLILGMIGCMLLMGNTATIDTGKMNKDLHTFCASRFFIITFVAQILNTIIFAQLQQKTNLISKYNLYAKYFVLFLLVLQLIDSSIKEYLIGVSSDKDKFLEWTLTATVISMFISMGFDVQKYQFVFVDTAKKQSVEHQNQNLVHQTIE